MRQALLDGDFFVGSTLAAAMTKMALRYSHIDGIATTAVHKLKARAMFVMASVAHLGNSNIPTTSIPPDARDRIMVRRTVLPWLHMYLKPLSHPSPMACSRACVRWPTPPLPWRPPSSSRAMPPSTT